LGAGGPSAKKGRLKFLSSGWTALIEAVVLGDGGPRHQACVRALLEAGADRRIADRSGRTSAQLARDRGYVAMTAMLESGGKK